MNNNQKDFIRASLGLATAQICHGLGWHSVHRSSHDILTDLLERYINQVSKTAVNISQTCSRTIPNLEDVALTFEHLGIHLHELQDYVQQVEPTPNPNPLALFPVKTQHDLLDFSGEDHLPAPIKIAPTVETEPGEAEIKEEPMEEDVVDGPTSEERPNNLSFRTNGIESPPYSPLEPKNLNLGALTNLDLTRPDLKVTAPKGYTPITTSPSPAVVSTVCLTTVSKATITTTTTTTTPSPAEQVTFTSPKSEPILIKSEKKLAKKEKKESSKKPTPDKKEPSQKSLLSPPISVIDTGKINSPVSSNGSGGKSKKTKSASPSPVVEKKEIQPPELNSSIKLPNSSPFLHGSPDSSLFSPPRKKLAMYQSDKKKPSKEKSNKESKSKKPDKNSPALGGCNGGKENKTEKSSKKSSLNSPLSISPFSSPHKIISPPSVKRESSPPHLSSPLIKKDSAGGAPKRTVIFPPSNNSPSPSDANRSQPSPITKHINDTVKTEKDENSPRVKIEEEEEASYRTFPVLNLTPISVNYGKIPKEESSETPVFEPKKKKKKERHTAESIEQEIDVMSLSQDEASYTETFKPNMFFPSFNDEKKKKKKKNKDKEKQREEKIKKNDGLKEKKEKKKKREEQLASSSSAIPRLTLKMGTETISDAPTKFASVPRGPCSPMNKFSTAMHAAALPPPPPIKKKKKDKHKQKEKDREREKERDKDCGFYVETITNTSSAPDVYYCPGCGKPDDGSPMIGCDSCDDWYHWPCVGIEEEPDEDVKWFCPNHTKKKKKKKKRDDL